MSQYPSPYQSPYQPPQPQYQGFAPPPDLAAPAKRAGLLMTLLGVLTLLLGGCFAAFGAWANTSELPLESQQQIEQLEAQSHLNIGTAMKILGVVITLPGIAMIVVGLFVRGGGMASAIIGIVLTAIVLLILSIWLLAEIWNLAKGLPVAMPTLIMAAVIGLFVLLMRWLILAVKNASQLSQMKQYQQAYLYQMQQQAYGQQQQYQYPMPPPPPPPVP